MENRPIIALNYSVCMYIAKSCLLLCFECSGHVSDGFPKQIWMEGWVGGVSSIQFFWDFWHFFNFAKPLTNNSILLLPIMSSISIRPAIQQFLIVPICLTKS